MDTKKHVIALYAMKLAYQMGRDSLRREIEDWLPHGFDYENSVMTVHTVRETVQRYCRVI